MMREATVVTLASCLVFAAAGGATALAFGFSLPEVLVIGAASMFSSTIIGTEAAPHHHTAPPARRGGSSSACCCSRTVIAIVILLGLDAASRPSLSAPDALRLAAALPAIVAVAAAMERWVLMPLIGRFDRIREYVFLVAIGWCLGISSSATPWGSRTRSGRFIAGVASPAAPIATFIAESLKRCATSSS